MKVDEHAKWCIGGVKGPCNCGGDQRRLYPDAMAEIDRLEEELRLSGLRSDSLDRVVGYGVQQELRLEVEIDRLMAEIAALKEKLARWEKLMPGMLEE